MANPRKIDEQGFVFRASDHKYFLDGNAMTGVTTILGILDKNLHAWSARQATEYIKEYAPKTKDGWTVTAELLDLAKTAYSRFASKRADEGTSLHAKIEEYVNLSIANNGGNPLESMDEVKPFAEWAEREKIRFLRSEARFYSRSMFVAGTADLIFEKDGKRYIGDVKNKKKIWDRTPFFQCAGYSLLAEEMDEGVNPFVGYCIIRVYKGELEALWSFDVEGDKRAFRACVEIYRQKANFKAI